MYLIRLVSGEERTFATIEALAAAVQRGEITRDAAIFHRRSNRWLPLEHHPYFQYATGERPAVPDAPADPEPPEPPAPPAQPVPDADPPRSLIEQEDRKTPSRVEPLRPEPIAPTPLKVPPAPERRPEPDRYTESFRRIDTTPPAVERMPPPRQVPEPLAVSPPRGRRVRTLITLIVVLGTAVGIFIGLRLRQQGASGQAESASTAPGYRPAPPPSSLLKADTTATGDTPVAPAVTSAGRIDPTAPASPSQLMERRRQSFLAARNRLGQELAAVDFNAIFGVRALSTPEGARAARRTVASALNVMGQFHRQEVMTDRAYEDTANFQTTRAGWTRDQIALWQSRRTLKEPYQSADLAESLLADADSLLAILGGGTRWTVSGDTLFFPDSARARAYRAQRARLVLRAGDPVTDTAQRPTLAFVRGAVEPGTLPVAGE